MLAKSKGALGAAVSLPEYLVEQAPVQKAEKIEEYIDLARNLAAEVEPSCFLEWIFLKDLIDALWDIRRYKRVKTAVLETAQRDQVEKLLKALVPDLSDPIKVIEMITGARTKAFTWATDPEARRKIDEQLSKQGHSAQEILAEAMKASQASLEGIERLLTAAESRCDRALQNYERYGRAFVKRLKATVEKIVDADFEEVPQSKKAP